LSLRDCRRRRLPPRARCGRVPSPDARSPHVSTPHQPHPLSLLSCSSPQPQPQNDDSSGLRPPQQVPGRPGLRRGVRLRGRRRLLRDRPDADPTGAHLVVRFPGGQLHRRRSVSLQIMGKLGPAGRRLLLFYHSHHHRLRRLGPRQRGESRQSPHRSQRRRQQSNDQHCALFALPPLRDRALGHEFQPGARGGHRQSEERG
jgi:hypothetical protein